MTKAKPVRKRKAVERARFILRLDPDLAEWLQSQADVGGRSRNALVTRCLSAIRDAHREADVYGDQVAPEVLLNALAHTLLRKLMDLGVMKEFDLFDDGGENEGR